MPSTSAGWDSAIVITVLDPKADLACLAMGVDAERFCPEYIAGQIVQ